jgi:uncharacterized repeat protein (TIGR02543 family)
MLEMLNIDLKRIGKVRRKFLSLLLTAAMAAALVPAAAMPVNAASEVWNGDTVDFTAGNPGNGTSAETAYEISTAEQLAYLAQQVNAGTGYAGVYFKLTDDIVLNAGSEGYLTWGEDGQAPENEWTPIGVGGVGGTQFCGVFDGNGKTVSGIYIDTEAGYQGLFGRVGAGGAVENIGVTKSFIQGGSYVGGVTGQNYGTVRNCYNIGFISSAVSAGDDDIAHCTGGIMGENNGAAQNCYNAGFVSGGIFVGGIAGFNGGILGNCYNIGSVSGYQCTGGITGSNDDYEKVEKCYNTGSVSGSSSVGGVAGYNYFGTLENCYNAGSVSGGAEAGGIAGTNRGGTVTDCYYDKQICPAGGIGYDNCEDSSAEGLLTSEMTGGQLSGLLGDAEDWVFGTGLYPRLSGYVSGAGGHDYNMEQTNAAIVSATPVFLPYTSDTEYETADSLKSDFTLGTANGVYWVSNDTDVIGITGITGNTAEVRPRSAFATVTLTAHSSRIYSVGRDVALTVFWAPDTIACPIDGCTKSAVVIESREQLEAVGRNEELLGGCYVLGNDIDLAGEDWTPLDTFTGHFSGGGHKIMNLTVDIDNENIDGYAFLNYFDEEDTIVFLTDNPDSVVSGKVYGAGLFKKLEHAVVAGLTLETPSVNVEFSGGNQRVIFAGALTGLAEGGEIRGVSVIDPEVHAALDNSANNHFAVGGLAGYFAGVTPVSGVSVSGGKVTGSAIEVSYENPAFAAVGGIVGASWQSGIVNAVSDTDVRVYNEAYDAVQEQLNIYAGGIAGYSSAAGKLSARFPEHMCIHNSYSSSGVFIENIGNDVNLFGGGLAGYLEDSAINNYYVFRELGLGCSSLGEVEVYYGALFGKVRNPIADGEVSYIISRNYSQLDSMAVGETEGGGFVGTAEMTTASALLAALNDGRRAVAEGIVEQYGGDFAMDGVFPWKIAADTNGGWPVLAQYVVIFEANGGSAVSSQRVVGNETAAQPAAPTRRGYSFAGWYADSGLTTAFDFTTPITGDITLYAKWTRRSSGNNGNNGGGTPPVNSVTTSSEKLEIPAGFLSNSAAGGTVTLNSNVGSVTVPSNMLAGIPGAAGKQAEIVVGQGDKDSLPDDVKDAIGGHPLISLTLLLDGEQTDWSNSDAPVTVSIPYTPTAEELANPEGIVIWHIDGDGNAVCVPNGRYDPATGTVTFDITHFSDFAVVYHPVSFSDVAAGAWYGKAVSFIAARDITTGTGDGKFSPDAKLTRGQFLVMLMKAYEIAPDVTEAGSPAATNNFADEGNANNSADTGNANNFADAGNTYYTGYLAAAKRLGISGGVGDNMFAPEKEITRQEMFALLYNALKVINRLPEAGSEAAGSAIVGKSLSDFSDADRIASWATEALTLLTQTGTVAGSNCALAPLSTTTRAEMAQVLYNLLGK